MTARYRLLVVLAALTCAVLLVDLGRPAWTAPLRQGAALVLGPVQQALTSLDDDEVLALTQERNELAGRVAQLEAEAELVEDLGALRRSASWGDHDLLPGRVIGFAAEGLPVGSRTVTIDVGQEDGVRADQTVVNTDGLVGRVLRVSPTTSDVALLGDADVVVGVRVGAAGALGTVQARPVPELPERAAGELTLVGVGDAPLAVGDVVTTLGSPDEVPYAAGVPLGEVTSVDPDRGELGRTAAVRPYVDPDLLDLVAVVVVEPR